MSKKRKKECKGKSFSTDEYSMKILGFLFKSGKKPVSLKDIAQKCRCGKKYNKRFNDAMNSLIESGKIFEFKRGFVRTDIMGYFTAKVVKLNRTFGFIEKTGEQEKIFVPGKFLAGALPGDAVLARYIPSHSENPEGEVIDIIEPAQANLSGIITEENGVMYFLSDSMSKTPIRIVPDGAECKQGDKVLAQVVYRGRRHSEHMVKIIMSFGSSLRASGCAQAIIAESGVVPEFPEKVLHDAKKLAVAGVWEYDLKNRLDLRDKIIFTIDSAESKDLDDAVSVERQADGYLLGVHIADVSHYVRENSPLDNEALDRGTSIYYADKVIPMLPKELSNGICSLNPNENRLTFSAIMHLSAEGVLKDFKFEKSVICSKVKGVYSEINTLLDGTADNAVKEKYAGLEDSIKLMDELADILIEKRRKRGAPEIETAESKLILENDVCVGVKPRIRGKSEMIIEEFMLTANEAAARLAGEKEIPFVYRVHEPPSEKKITDLKDSLSRLDVEVPSFSSVKPVHFAEILQNAKDKPIYPVVNMMTLRSMAKAKYEPEPKGHFGLALDDYAHFTSPIRRYPDLAIHRILSDLTDGADTRWIEKRYAAFVQRASLRSTETEIRAMNIERDCEDCYKAEYMQQHLGEVFEGIISSVTEFGFYVQLPDTIEGLVHINSLPEGNYCYDGYFSIADEFSSRIFTVGDRVRVMCARADVNSGKIDFEIENNEE